MNLNIKSMLPFEVWAGGWASECVCVYHFEGSIPKTAAMQSAITGIEQHWTEWHGSKYKLGSWASFVWHHQRFVHDFWITLLGLIVFAVPVIILSGKAFVFSVRPSRSIYLLMMYKMVQRYRCNYLYVIHRIRSTYPPFPLSRTIIISFKFNVMSNNKHQTQIASLYDKLCFSFSSSSFLLIWFRIHMHDTHTHIDRYTRTLCVSSSSYLSIYPSYRL